MQTILKKSVAVILTLLILISIPVSAGAISSSIYVVFNYPKSYGGTTIYPKNKHNGEIASTEWVLTDKSSGERLYCIQLGYHLNNSTQITTSNSKAWGKLKTKQQNAIKAILAYGREGSWSSSTWTNQLTGETVKNCSSDEAYLATQLLVWEVTKGYRTVDVDRTTTDGKKKYFTATTKYRDVYQNQNVKDIYDGIVENVKKYNLRPDFAYKSKANATKKKNLTKSTFDCVTLNIKENGNDGSSTYDFTIDGDKTITLPDTTNKVYYYKYDGFNKATIHIKFTHKVKNKGEIDNRKGTTYTLYANCTIAPKSSNNNKLVITLNSITPANTTTANNVTFDGSSESVPDYNSSNIIDSGDVISVEEGGVPSSTGSLISFGGTSDSTQNVIYNTKVSPVTAYLGLAVSTNETYEYDEEEHYYRNLQIQKGVYIKSLAQGSTETTGEYTTNTDAYVDDALDGWYFYVKLPTDGTNSVSLKTMLEDDENGLGLSSSDYTIYTNDDINNEEYIIIGPTNDEGLTHSVKYMLQQYVSDEITTEYVPYGKYYVYELGKPTYDDDDVDDSVFMDPENYEIPEGYTCKHVTYQEYKSRGEVDDDDDKSTTLTYKQSTTTSGSMKTQLQHNYLDADITLTKSTNDPDMLNGLYFAVYKYASEDDAKAGTNEISNDWEGPVLSDDSTVGANNGKIVVTRQNSSGTAVSGSEWQLYKVNQNGDDTLCSVTLNRSWYYYDDSGLSRTTTTMSSTSDGKLQLWKLPTGQYYLKEVTAPDGLSTYYRNIEFTISEKTNDITYTARSGTGFSGEVYIYRQDADGNALGNSKWQLYTADGTLCTVSQTGSCTYKYNTSGSLDTLTGDTSGTVYVSNLPEGSYYLEEVEAPEGSSLYGQLQFSILPDSDSYIYEFYAQDGDNDTEVAIYNGTALRNCSWEWGYTYKVVELGYYAGTNNTLSGYSTADKLIDYFGRSSYYTSINYYSNFVETTNSIYEDLIETVDDPGFESYEAIFTLDKDFYEEHIDEINSSGTVEINFVNTYSTYLRLYKSGSSTGGVSGAVYGIYSNSACEDEFLIESLTTGSNGYVTSQISYAFGSTYYLKEISAPAGYTVDETVYELELNAEYLGVESSGASISTINPVESDGSDKTTKLYIYNTKQQADVEVQDDTLDVKVLKIDDNKNPIAGATLQLYRVIDTSKDLTDSNLEYVTEFTSVADEDGYDISNLVIVGETYVLRETETPDGYYTAADVKFVVNNETDTQTVTMTDEPISY